MLILIQKPLAISMTTMTSKGCMKTLATYDEVSEFGNIKTKAREGKGHEDEGSI